MGRRRKLLSQSKEAQAEAGAEVDRLRAENADLRAAVDRLTKQVEELGKQVAELTKALTAAQRASKRQAAPFRREKCKAAPKRPGRKPGHKGERRPLPDKVDRDRQGPALTCCPDCGGGVRNVHQCVNYEVDLPKVEPEVTKNLFHSGWCPACGKLVYAPHPEQTSTATGAAACHLGPRMRSFAVDLKHRLGVPYRKTVDLLKTHFDFEVSPGGIVLANYRLATVAEPTYEAVREELSRSELVHADETGWRVGTASWWTWVLCSARLTLYRITDHRNAKVVKELLGGGPVPAGPSGLVHPRCARGRLRAALHHGVGRGRPRRARPPRRCPGPGRPTSPGPRRARGGRRLTGGSLPLDGTEARGTRAPRHAHRRAGTLRRRPSRRRWTPRRPQHPPPGAAVTPPPGSGTLSGGRNTADPETAFILVMHRWDLAQP